MKYSKGLFRNLVYELGRFMAPSDKIYVQTFLSGTAYQEVLKTKEATGYSYHFVDCPFLTRKALYEIVDHFAKRHGDDELRWMCNQHFVRLLDDTGGLPRAVQFLLEACFSVYPNRRELFAKLPSLDAGFVGAVFNDILHRLDDKYAIKTFVQHHRLLALELLRCCLGAIPVRSSACYILRNQI